MEAAAKEFRASGIKRRTCWFCGRDSSALEAWAEGALVENPENKLAKFILETSEEGREPFTLIGASIGEEEPPLRISVCLVCDWLIPAVIQTDIQAEGGTPLRVSIEQEIRNSISVIIQDIVLTLQNLGLLHNQRGEPSLDEGEEGSRISPR